MNTALNLADFEQFAVQPTGTFARLSGGLSLAEPKPEPGVRRRLTLDDFDQYDLVIKRLNEDILKNPEDAQTRYNKGAWMLSAGVFNHDAWSSLSWRLQLEGCVGEYSLFPIEIWDGDDISNANLFVWLEQGIGDQIQAASLFNEALKRCRSLTVYCNRRVWPLFKRSFPGVNVLKPGQLKDFKQFDYQMTFSDLGQALIASFEDFPRHEGYLKTDQARTAELRAKYQALRPGNKVIGLSWRSSNAKIGDGKSIPLRSLSGLISKPGVTWVSLQYSETQDELGQPKLYRDPTINQMWDMDSFASQVAALDGVISISNTALHVGGAVGVKTLGLLSRGGCRNWYWFNDRKDSPWYPSVELVRQDQPGDWRTPILRAKEWLNG